MQLRTRTWCLLSVVLLAAAWACWEYGNRVQERNSSSKPGAAKSTNGPRASLSNGFVLLTGSSNSPIAKTKTAAVAIARDPRHPYRLANANKTVDQFVRSDHAILLRNALVDTSVPDRLDIPNHLKAGDNPGSYIIQSRGPTGAAFRSLLKSEGAEVVSYIPNDAWLVRAAVGQARRIAANPLVQSILPFEPYFKLSEELLPLAVDQKPLPPDMTLKALLFPGEKEVMAEKISKMGGTILGEDRSTFGPVMVFRAPADSLTTLAQAPQIQELEVQHERAHVNDLTRVTLGVSTDTVVTNNYLDLTGTNVLVNVNDTGIDATHPDLAGRVSAASPSTLIDLDGHGTHVAGIIASSGANSSSVTNAIGSLTNANFRGKAPAAKLFVLPIDLNTGPLISDAYLQETAAQTNATISNNSWAYRGALDYNISAASYDAAVRDALSQSGGSQPLIYVFAAGNDGFGTTNGLGGEAGSISSPATAKNVITVGALDSPRYITNEVTTKSGTTSTTNAMFIGDTDSNDQVASYSSLGNVGIGIEGTYGRMKPDVVAPGSFIVSTKAKGWNSPVNSTNVSVQTFVGQTLDAGGRGFYSIFVPDNAVRFRIRLLPNGASPTPFPLLPILLRFSVPPTDADQAGANAVSVPPDRALAKGDSWFYTIVNPTSKTVSFDIQTLLETTNNLGNYFTVLKTLNDGLGPYYRYETGTSMAAPAVTGMLALMQEFFDRVLLKPYSPALFKALLINGARPGGLYDVSPQSTITYEGWGVANITNSLPSWITTNKTDETTWPVKMIDQNPAHALATGEEHTWKVQLSDEAWQLPMRITLVWTDPPGNPSAGVKLVNDLDLIVTNLDTGEVFYGNDIASGFGFNQPLPPNTKGTNDVVNNVENVFLKDPLGTNYTITVVGRRVNVNAVTANTNSVVQDYALVVSSGNGEVDQTFKSFTLVDPPAPLSLRDVRPLTNGVPLLAERVGANFPLSANRIGQVDQWNFYVFTNTPPATNTTGLTNGQYVAFTTFFPINVSRPRNFGGDVDLYVSSNPGLTNLDPAVVASADKSTNTGIDELVFYTNAVIGQVFYIGVKSEDQQSAEYGFVGLSSKDPFDSDDGQGNRVLKGVPVNAPIPDGSPSHPGGVLIFAIGTKPELIKKVTVTNSIVHESVGDLLGNLSHNRSYVVLNNHNLDNGNTNLLHTFVYDDSDSGQTLYSTKTDGPGSLNDFVGTMSSGAWILSMVDNTESHSGYNANLTIRIEPNELLGTNGIRGTVLGNRCESFFVDVPPDASRLRIILSEITGPLNVYVKNGAVPDANNYDKAAFLSPPGGELAIGVNDVPPLVTGRYYIQLCNPGSSSVDFRIAITMEKNLPASFTQTFLSISSTNIIDDAITYSTVNVPVSRSITDVKVGVRIDHPRASDLVLHLISPQGKRILLAENRGGTNTLGYGSGIDSNIVFTTFTDNTALTGIPIKFADTPFVVNPLTNALPPSVMQDDFEAIPPGQYGIGTFMGGWLVDYARATIVNGGAFTGNRFVRLNGGGGTKSAQITSNIVLSAGSTYRLSFAYRNNGVGGTQSLGVFTNDAPFKYISAIPPDAIWHSTSIVFKALSSPLALSIGGITAGGCDVDSVVIREGLQSSEAYYLPEESMKDLVGDPSLGDWKLEVWDNRAGPLNAIPQLIRWELKLTFAPVLQNAIKLTNCVSYTNIVVGNELQYFIVDVPRTATAATNILIGTGDLVLYGDRNGLPQGNANDEYFIDINGSGGGEFLLMTTNSPPAAPLRPGQRYYLAVGNFAPGVSRVTNAFSLTVCLNGLDTNSVKVITLTNSITYNNTNQPGAALDYYRYVASTNVKRLIFTVTPQNENVDLVVRYAQPVPDPLPTLTTFDYISSNPALFPDVVRIATNSSPVAVTNGIWYLGVANLSTNPARYRIVAVEETNDLPVIVLTNSIAYDASLPVPPVDRLFKFNVNTNDPGFVFEANNSSGTDDVLIGYGVQPDYANFFWQTRISTNVPTKFVVRRDNLNPAIEGEYYVAIYNQEATNLNVRMKYSLLSSNIQYTKLTNGVSLDGVTAALLPAVAASPTNAAPEWDHYTYNVTNSNTKILTITLTGRYGGSILHVGRTPDASDYKAFAGTNNAIRVMRGSATNDLTNGTLYISVENEDPSKTSSTYTLAASEQLTGEIVTLHSGEIHFDRAFPGFEDYYKFTVTSNMTSVQFVLDKNAALSTSNLDFYLRKGLPLPNEKSYDFKGLHFTNGTDIASMMTLTLGGTNISAGDWYLSVTNRGANAVDYYVLPTATFVDTTVSTNLIIAPATVQLTGRLVCVTWAATVNDYYDIQVKTNLNQPTWQTVVSKYLATSNPQNACFSSLFSDQLYVRIARTGSLTNPPPNTNIVVTVPIISPTTMCLQWTSNPGSNYVIQGTSALSNNAVWVNVVSNLTATGTTMTGCVPLPSPYSFFRVVQGSATNSVPAAPLKITPSVTVSPGKFTLSWNADIGSKYEVDYTTNYFVSWNILTNLTATSNPMTFTDTNAVSGSVSRFYRVLKLP